MVSAGDVHWGWTNRSTNLLPTLSDGAATGDTELDVWGSDRPLDTGAKGGVNPSCW